MVVPLIALTSGCIGGGVWCRINSDVDGYHTVAAIGGCQVLGVVPGRGIGCAIDHYMITRSGVQLYVVVWQMNGINYRIRTGEIMKSGDELDLIGAGSGINVGRIILRTGRTVAKIPE